MNVWEKITGNDMTKELKNFERRVKKLPAEYQDPWESIQTYLWHHANFSGRNLMSMLEGVLQFLEESAADGLGIHEVLGEDIEGFCLALADGKDARSVRDKWRKKLNDTISKKLDK